MKKWKTVRVRQELLEEAKKEMEKSPYQNLSDFISDAIRFKMQKLTKERIPKYLERDKLSRVPRFKANAFYSTEQIWSQETPKGTIKIGITDYFQSQLKEIVNIKTNKIGEKVDKNEPFGVAETWWFVHDLFPPIDGKIVRVNSEVVENPFTLNTNPYQWIVEVIPLTEPGSAELRTER